MSRLLTLLVMLMPILTRCGIAFQNELERAYVSVFEYRENEDGRSVSILEYDGPDVVIHIPAKIAGRPVTAIEGLGKGRAKVQEVVLEDGVETIGHGAFEGAEQLQRVVLPDTLKNIEDLAFYGCRSLKKIDLPPGLEAIGREAFYGCESIASLYIPPKVQKIGKGAFSMMTSLAQIAVDEGNPCFTALDGVLFGCHRDAEGSDAGTWELMCYPCAKEDERYVIPTETSEICEGAITEVTALRDLDVSSSVKTLGPDSISDLPNLQTIRLHEGLEAIGEGVLSDCPKVASLTIPGTVGIVGDDALSHMDSLQICVFEEGVTALGACVLDTNKSLCLVYLPSSLESIGRMVSSIPKNKDYIDQGIAGGFNENEQRIFLVVKERSYAQTWAHQEDSNIHHTWMYQIPAKEGDTAAEFRDEYDRTVICEAVGGAVAVYAGGDDGEIWLHYVSKNESPSFEVHSSVNGYTVSGIDESAFSQSLGLKRIILPETIKSVADRAFKGVPLTELRIPSSVQTLGEGAFFGIDIESLTIPANIREIPDMAFAITLQLKELTIENGVESIGSEAFFRAPLEKVTLPPSVRSIASDAFSHFDGMTFYVERNSYAESACISLGYKYEYTDAEGASNETSARPVANEKLPIIFPSASVEKEVRKCLSKIDGEPIDSDPIYPSDVAQIERLELTAVNDMYSIEFLRGFVGLKELSLAGSFTDLSPLANLTALEDLSMAYCDADDLSPLENLTNLEKLDIRGTRTESYDSLGKLPKLETLILMESDIDDVTPLANLTNLKFLDLDETEVTSIGALCDLPQLEELSLFDCPTITDEEALLDMPALQTVWLITSNRELRESMGERMKPDDGFLGYQ